MDKTYTITNDGAGNSRLVIPMCDRCAAVTPPDQMFDHPGDTDDGVQPARRVCVPCYIDALDELVQERLGVRR